MYYSHFKSMNSTLLKQVKTPFHRMKRQKRFFGKYRNIFIIAMIDNQISKTKSNWTLDETQLQQQ